MWLCKNCGEQVEDDTFEVCWKCGTGRDGVTMVPPPDQPRQTMHTCPNCQGIEVYESRPVSSGNDGMTLLPGLGGWLTAARFRVIVCRSCGLTRFFADDAARARLQDSSQWTRLNPDYLDDIKDL